MVSSGPLQSRVDHHLAMPLAPLKLIRAATAAALVSALAPTAPAQDAKRDPKPATFRADRALGERSRVAVVRLGQGLSLVQPFTSNAEHLRRAVELVTNTAPDAQQSVLAQAQLAADYYRKLNAAGTHTAGGAAPALTSPR